MKRILIIMLKVLSYIGVLLALLFCIVILTLFALNLTNHLSPVARYYLNKNIAGVIYFENLQLGFNQFPIVELHADNGHLISALNNNPTDTLARFKKLDVKIDVMRLMDDSLSIVIPRVSITDGFALVTIDKDGVPGWNVWRFKPPRPKGSKPSNRERLYVSEVHLRGNNHFIYRNEKHKRTMDITSGALDLHGSIRIRNKEIYVTNMVVKDVTASFNLSGGKSIIKFATPRITLSSIVDKDLRVYTLNSKLNNTFLKLFDKKLLYGSDSVIFKGVGAFNFLKSYYSADSINISINNRTTFTIGGKYLEDKNNIDLNVIISLPNLLESIRDFHFDQLNSITNLKFNLPVILKAKANGYINLKTSVFPSFKIEVQSIGGSFDTGKYGKLYNIELFAKSKFNMVYPDSINVGISRLNVSYRHSLLELKGTITGKDSSIIADIDANAHLNLADFSAYIRSGLGLRGHLHTKAHINSPLSNNTTLKNTSLLLEDTIYIKNLFFNIPHTVASVYANDARIKLNQLKNQDFANINFILNRTELKSIAEIDATISRVTGSADIYKNSNMIFPRLDNGKLDLHSTRAITSAGDTLRLGDLFSYFSSESMRGNDPFVKYYATLNNISLTSPDSTGIYINDIGIMSHAALYKSANFNQDNLKLWDAIGNWKFNGELVLNNAQFIMPNLPLYSKIPKFDVVFNENDAKLRQLHLILGGSEAILTGSALNWHDYILNDSLLTLDANIKSTRINLNQLIPAIIQGAAYNQSRKKFISQKSKLSKFVAVPPNIDACLLIEASNAIYGAAMLDTLSTIITLRNKHLKVHDFKFRSNIVDVNLDFSYHTPKESFADADINFEMNGINASQAIGLIPKISTSLPILSTFEGMFAAKVHTKWQLDSIMAINTSSITSSISIEGRNLSVVKKKILPQFLGWILFGNREKIRIDSLDINAKIENNRLSILPTTFNIGRYQLGLNGVMGRKNLYYHIALLKSPIGLKLGFDIYGSFNKLKWRFACVEGKDNKTISTQIDNNSMNLMIMSDNYNLNTRQNIIYLDKDYSIAFEHILFLINNNIPLTIDQVNSQRQKMNNHIKMMHDIIY